MKLEDQLCSIELAIKLRDIGIKQEGLCYYIKVLEKYMINEKGIRSHEEYKWKIGHPNGYEESFDHCCAFTASEVGELLPDKLPCKSATADEFNYISQKGNGMYGVAYFNGRYSNPQFTDSNEANARALMLIHLIENDLLKLEKPE